jgi:hypothetical protein
MEKLREKAIEEFRIFERFSNSTCKKIIEEWTQPKHETVEQCTWESEDVDYGTYNTTCGECFCLTDSTLSENNMNYCCFCGKKINEPDSVGER